jgi:hypothetical protein
MAGDARRLPSDAKVRELLALYTSAQRDIALQVTRAIAAGDVLTRRRRAAQLQSVLDVLARLGVEGDPVARDAVLQASLDGAKDAATGIRKIGVELTQPGELSFASVNAEAVATMQDSLLASLDGARTTVGRQVQDVFAREGRQQAMRALLGAEASPQQARRRLAARLAEQGQTGFVDRAGRRWSLDRYAEMAVRTTTREAVVQGSVNRMTAHGVNLANSCTICKPYEGRVIDLAGGTTDYRGEPVMDASFLPPFHPNCAHTIQPVASRIDTIRQRLAATGAS